MELTVPWEDRLEEAQERKRAKYADLVAECQRNGWKVRYEPIRWDAGVSQARFYTGCWGNLEFVIGTGEKPLKTY